MAQFKEVISTGRILYIEETVECMCGKGTWGDRVIRELIGAVRGLIANRVEYIDEVDALKAELAEMKGRDTYRLVSPLEDGEPVQYVGVYVLKWRPEWGEPEVGFVEEPDNVPGT